MAKRESTFVNMTVTLVVISAIAALALGYVNKITEEPIRLAQEKKLKEALKVVLPEFENITTKMVKPEDAEDSLTCYIADKGGEIVGVAVKTYTMKGFSGFVQIMVGFKPDGSIVNTAVLQHAETPGLGDKMDVKKSNFPTQFIGKNPKDFNLTVKKDGGDVDAITAATISSRAFCDATKRAFETLKKEGLLNE